MGWMTGGVAWMTPARPQDPLASLLPPHNGGELRWKRRCGTMSWKRPESSSSEANATAVAGGGRQRMIPGGELAVNENGGAWTTPHLDVRWCKTRGRRRRERRTNVGGGTSTSASASRALMGMLRLRPADRPADTIRARSTTPNARLQTFDEVTRAKYSTRARGSRPSDAELSQTPNRPRLKLHPQKPKPSAIYHTFVAHELYPRCSLPATTMDDARQRCPPATSPDGSRRPTACHIMLRRRPPRHWARSCTMTTDERDVGYGRETRERETHQLPCMATRSRRHRRPCRMFSSASSSKRTRHDGSVRSLRKLLVGIGLVDPLVVAAVDDIARMVAAYGVVESAAVEDIAQTFARMSAADRMVEHIAQAPYAFVTQRLRKSMLEKRRVHRAGGSPEELDTLKDFLGCPPNSEAFLQDLFGTMPASKAANL
ncbi:hypothetical protein BJ912DRAFT_1144602 [Pholiota molesta]|nr:hypothetical protein BJ912DRAFT_1144602 [Pholiota molesta]